ncbi:MAG: fluoride efflux transporter CrcB [Bacteroidota bacterium]
MFRSILLAGAGGFIGTILRYLTGVAANRWIPSSWPWATFTVNITGSFIIGIVFAISARVGQPADDWKIFLATGICGGFTTFSAFAQENLRFLQQGDHTNFLLYTGASVIFGVLAAAAGMLLVRGI